MNYLSDQQLNDYCWHIVVLKRQTLITHTSQARANQVAKLVGDL